MYRLRFFFDAGSGICLWSGNDAARERFDYPVDVEDLPLCPETRARINQMTARYDQSIDWDDPSDPGPWSQNEQDRFDEAVAELVDRVRRELGDTYEIVDEYGGCRARGG